jgi:hypothetical protein
MLRETNMSKLIERYPNVRRLPAPDSPIDDAGLLKLLEPYLGWMLAEIDTGSVDILISESVNTSNDQPNHLVLLTGRAVVVWLRHAMSNLDSPKPDDTPAG